MKKTTLFLAISMILISMITSCKKDETTTTTTTTTPKHDTLYYVQYDGKKYEVDKCHAFYDDLFASGGLHAFDLYLVSKSVTYDVTLNDMFSSGNGMIISIASNSATSFAHDPCVIDTSGDQVDFWEMTGSLLLNADYFMKTGTTVPLKTGSVSIKELVSDTFEIKGSFISYDFKVVKVYYKGAIPIHQKF